MDKWDYSEKRRRLQSARSLHTLHPVNCRLTACPEFRRCPQVGSQERLFGQASADVFFIFDAPHPNDLEDSTPFMGSSGQIFREQVLSPFAQKTGLSYRLSYLVRSTQDEGRRLGKKSYDFCWNHLLRDLAAARPKLVVAFGASVYSFLVSKAVNRRELEGLVEQPTMAALRRGVWPLTLLDFETKLAVCYSPGFILNNPTASRFIDEDVSRLVAYSKGRDYARPADKPSSVAIEKIDVLRTADEVVNFLDQLARGDLLTVRSPVAFDTETFNLNRKFNNAFLSWQFSLRPGEAVVLPIEHPDLPLFSSPDEKGRLIRSANELFNTPSSRSNIDMFVAHNAKFDLSVLYGHYGIIQKNPEAPFFWCTQNAMHWLDENRKGLAKFMEGGAKPYALKTLGKEFFGFTYRTEHLEARSDGSLSALSIDELAEYGGSDTILTLALQKEQMRQASLQPEGADVKLMRFMRYYYSKTNRSLALMECNGIYIDDAYISHLQGENSPIWNRIAEIQRQLQNSPEVLDFRRRYSAKLSSKTTVEYDTLWGDEPTAELVELDVRKKNHQKYLYVDFLGLEPLEYSAKTKEPSFDGDFLAHYAQAEHYKQARGVAPYLDYYNTPCGVDDKGEPTYPPNPMQLIAEFAKLDKLGGTYLNGMQKLLDDKQGDCRDSRIRASYHPTGTDTGRLSSSSPNFQNLPAGRTKAAKEIKNMFQAEPPSRRWPSGTCLIQVDYAAAEVFWAVNFSGEPELVTFLNHCASELNRAYDNGDSLSDEEFEKIILSTDFHKRTASLMFEIEPENVSKAMRQDAKAITFGLLYGKTVKGLAADNGWSEEDAQAKMRKFFAAFPRLERWLKEQIETARRRGYVETMMGRRRRLSHFYATRQPKHAGEADRKAMNSPIQGQSSDAGVIGLNNFIDYLLANNLERRWLVENVVHDSILFQVPMEDVRRILPVIKQCLTVGMREYIEANWGVTVPVTLRCDFEMGLRYGDLHGWDQREKTLGPLLEKIIADAKKLWARGTKEEKTVVSSSLRKPSAALDLVRWDGPA